MYTGIYKSIHTTNTECPYEFSVKYIRIDLIRFFTVGDHRVVFPIRKVAGRGSELTWTPHVSDSCHPPAGKPPPRS